MNIILVIQDRRQQNDIYALGANNSHPRATAARHRQRPFRHEALPDSGIAPQAEHSENLNIHSMKQKILFTVD
jgi:hypothetical protein